VVEVRTEGAKPCTTVLVGGEVGLKEEAPAAPKGLRATPSAKFWGRGLAERTGGELASALSSPQLLRDR
jgi:hypothetical protein